MERTVPHGSLVSFGPQASVGAREYGVTEFGMDNAGSIAVRITLAPSGHRGGGRKELGDRKEGGLRTCLGGKGMLRRGGGGQRACREEVDTERKPLDCLMHVMRIRRALKKLSFVKSEHRVRGEKWEKDCGGGDITGRQNLTGTSTGLEATQRRKKWGKSEIKKQRPRKKRRNGERNPGNE